MEGKSGGEMDQVFPQKLSPEYRFFGGKTDIQLEYTHCKDHGRPTFRVAGGRPATPHGRPAKGQNGLKDFLAGHHKLVSSQVPSTQPCGSKLSTEKQEREYAIFRKGSKGSGGITSRPPTFGVLPCVYNTNMGVRIEESDLRVVNIGLEVRKTGVERRRRNITGC